VKDGESMAICSLAEALYMNGFVMDLHAMNTRKHPFNGAQEKIQISFYHTISMVDINTGFYLPSFLLHFFSILPYQLFRFVHSAYKSELIKRLSTHSYEFILLETIYLMPYLDIIKKYSDAKIILRTHNLEFEIWNRLGSTSSNWIFKLLYSTLSKQIYRYETKQLRDIDFLFAISLKEWLFFNRFYPNIKGVVMPITWNCQAEIDSLKNTRKDISLFFIGSLDWKPNREGLMWFLTEIWPDLVSNISGIKFYVAGRNMPDWIQQMKIQQVTMVGEVEDATHFVKQHDICMVPLLSGSGMRAKIIEAMAHGKVVVSTTLGLEGISATHGYDICIADTPREFYEVLINLVNNPVKIKNIGLNAQRTIQEHFDSKTMGKILSDFLTR
jgi:glycosyltransferase involved in cell wall biosynthesis